MKNKIIHPYDYHRYIREFVGDNRNLEGVVNFSEKASWEIEEAFLFLNNFFQNKKKLIHEQHEKRKKLTALFLSIFTFSLFLINYLSHGIIFNYLLPLFVIALFNSVIFSLNKVKLIKIDRILKDLNENEERFKSSEFYSFDHFISFYFSDEVVKIYEKDDRELIFNRLKENHNRIFYNINYTQANISTEEEKDSLETFFNFLEDPNTEIEDIDTYIKTGKRN